MFEKKSTTRPLNSANKMLGIEVLRFISALSVLMWHFRHFAFDGLTLTESAVQTFPFYKQISILYDYGDYGVQVFWCISGFIFFWKYHESISKNIVSWKTFVALRFSRLYPLHFVTLIYVAATQATFTKINGEPFLLNNNDLFHFILQLFMVSSWRGKWGFTFNGPIWSVSVELLVYAAFFWQLRFGAKSSWFNVIVIFACALAQIMGLNTYVITCAGFFYAGGLVAKLINAKTPFAQRPGIKIAAWVGTFAMPAIGLSLQPGPHHDIYKMMFLNVYVPILILSLTTLRIPERFAHAVEVAGNMTYASYLVHFPLQLTFALICLLTSNRMPVDQPWLLLAYLGITFSAAGWIFNNFEMPAQNYLRSKLLNNKEGRPLKPASAP
jgi:peptidoglycan/LPS O-acetylase OafA/YrhL